MIIFHDARCMEFSQPGHPERPERIRGTVSFLNTITIFGTPTDVTLSELALEMLFPADEATIAIVRSMADEEVVQRSGDVHLQKTG